MMKLAGPAETQYSTVLYSWAQVDGLTSALKAVRGFKSRGYTS